MTIKERYSAAIEDAIAKAKFSRSRAVVEAEDGQGEAYAYPHSAGIAWGVNGPDGVNILRGIRTPEGQDIGEG